MNEINTYQQALLEATHDSLIYGHGFIRVTHNNNGFEVKRVDLDELFNLLKFLKDQKHVEL